MSICNACGFAFTNPPLSAELISNLYSQCGHGDCNLQSFDEALKSERERSNTTIDAKRMMHLDRRTKALNRVLYIRAHNVLFSITFSTLSNVVHNFA